MERKESCCHYLFSDDPESVAVYKKLEETDNIRGQICFLEKKRRQVMEQIHQSQKVLDCLDFLIEQKRRELK